MEKATINLYEFHELNEDAKTKAIYDHRNFMLEVLEPDYIDGVTNWDDPEKMEMYEDEYNYILSNDEPVIESIEINEYLFFYNGKMAHCSTFIRGGKQLFTELHLHGETYKIK